MGRGGLGLVKGGWEVRVAEVAGEAMGGVVSSKDIPGTPTFSGGKGL